MKVYKLEVRVSKQEDGLWRAEVPTLAGCFADAETLSQALIDVQECAAMALDVDIEAGKQSVEASILEENKSFSATIPLVLDEHSFKRVQPQAR